MICSYDNFEGKEVLECFRDIDDLRSILMIWVLHSFAGEKGFEYLRDIDDLRLTKLCR